ncbi:hypothetical protein [Rhizobium leguminosarum]|uniref:hypothetical protein n=1 Tax=Rhizobium leguminosarum TaxID=384 RepID=UPI001C937BED|nr:hypothetical protein [Rhizobium leguminosarum]MBY5462087.1 hypothetical protein [Rhizobium leguminosarum]
MAALSPGSSQAEANHYSRRHPGSGYRAACHDQHRESSFGGRHDTEDARRHRHRRCCPEALAETEAMVGDFIAGQTAEGFSLAEIDQLYVFELPLMLGYRVEGGRIRAQLDAQITERQS